MTKILGKTVTVIPRRSKTDEGISFDYFIRDRKHAMVFFMSIAMVIGPTPPGTGVIQPATGSQEA